MACTSSVVTWSHPAGVRGLKPQLIDAMINEALESHPAGVRGLKLGGADGDVAKAIRRTPQGCVD